MNNLRVLVVDDDPIARQELRNMLERLQVESVDEAATAVEALVQLQQRRYDLLLLDIQMPGLSGIEALKVINHMPQRPHVAFVTAFSDHTLEAFEEAAFDYLLKPIREERLRRTLERVVAMQSGTTTPPDKLPVHLEDRILLLDIDEIRFAYARGDRTFVVLFDREYPVRYTLGELAQRLGRRAFLRVHRSYLVNVDHIKEVHPFFSGTLILRIDDYKNTEIPVSRSAARTLRILLGL